MPDPVACMVCGAPNNARNGRHPFKYCDNHIPDGIARGHIKSKRVRPASPASSASTTLAGRLPDGWKLVELKKIYGSRCCPPPAMPPALPPSCLLPSCSHVTGLRRLRSLGRFYSEDFDPVDLENGLVEEPALVESLEYLLVGKFERKEGDACGPIQMRWLAAADLDASSLSDAQIDAALLRWEADEERRRAAAMTRVRAARAEAEEDA